METQREEATGKTAGIAGNSGEQGFNQVSNAETILGQLLSQMLENLQIGYMNPLINYNHDNRRKYDN